MTPTATRRALVLTDEQARHPFRRSLPPHVCATLIEEPERRSTLRTMFEDWKSLLATYCATFVAVIAFIA